MPDYDSLCVIIVAILMIALWLSNKFGPAIVALIPLFAFPFLAIQSAFEVSKSYCNSVIVLMAAAFALGIAIQKWKLHEVLAYKIISVVGTKPQNLVLGFIISTALLSMWISNTSATVIMVSIALAVEHELAGHWLHKETKQKFAIGLLLSVAYSASLGGMATIIGTPANLIMRQVYVNSTGEDLGFSQWFLLCFPLVLLLLTILYFVISKIYCPDKDELINLGKSIRFEQHKQGLQKEQKVLVLIFLSIVISWLTRVDLDLGFVVIPGWSNLLSQASYIDDSTVLISFVLLMFFWGKGDNKLLSWDDFKDFPWQVIILFGGGFALANAMESSGLSQEISTFLAAQSNLSIPLLLLIIILAIKFFSELASNTAVSQILLPLLAALAISMNIDPLIFLFPAAMSASSPMMLPVATPPNAIVYATGKLNMSDMWSLGLWLNLITATLIYLYFYFSLVHSF